MSRHPRIARLPTRDGWIKSSPAAGQQFHPPLMEQYPPALCLYRSTNIGEIPNSIFGEIYMMPAGTQILVLKEGTRRERGKGAQFNNIAAAKAVADAVRSTLGPRGMDKMLVDSLGDVVITNDGVTILKEIDIEHPAAKMLVEGAKA